LKSLRRKATRLSGLAVVTVALVLGQLASAPNANAVEQVLDGGFEAAAPAGNSPNWTEADSIFGTPLCDAGCGGVGPRSGSWWAWFGGTTSIQTSSLSQSVTIPSGTTATLNFYMWVSNAPAPQTASLTVKMDSTVINTYTPTTTDAGYVLRTFDVSAFANGAAHTLSFNYDNPTAKPTSPNIHVDDVSIDTSADTTAPQTTITSSPAGGVAKSLSVPISFTSSEPGSTFSCTLDTGTAAGCTSPSTLTVTPGQHTFKVAARDAANNTDATPASVTFTAYDCPTLTAAVTAAQAKVATATKAVAKAKKALKKAKKSGIASKIKRAKKKLKKAKAALKAANAALAAAQSAAVPCAATPTKVMAAARK